MCSLLPAKWAGGDTAWNHGAGARGQRCLAQPRQTAIARGVPAAALLARARLGYCSEPPRAGGASGISGVGERVVAPVSEPTPANPIRGITTAMKIAALALIRAYKFCVSPLLPPACRFHPTCSEYASEAIEKRGLWRGIALAVRRLARCHPCGGQGFDPVPDKHGLGTAG